MIPVALILFLAAVVQGMVGFALALIAVPLFFWSGLPLSEAIAISAASTFVQALTGTLKLRHAVPWPIVRSAIVVRLLALPLGIVALIQLHTFDSAKIKGFLGACLVILVLLQLLLKTEPRERLAPGWDYLAFASSGFFAGMVGMGGPPLVLWLSAHRWSNAKIKGFLFANFAFLAPVNLLLIWLSFGDSVLPATGTGFLFAPVVILGSLLGVHLGAHIPQDTFRKILFTSLIIAGIAAIIAALAQPDS